jgi:hypothetical protein
MIPPSRSVFHSIIIVKTPFQFNPEFAAAPPEADFGAFVNIIRFIVQNIQKIVVKNVKNA